MEDWEEEDARQRLRLAALVRARQELEVRRMEEGLAEAELAAILSRKRGRHIAGREEPERAAKRRR